MEYVFTTIEAQITSYLIDTLLAAFPNDKITVDYNGDEIIDTPTRDRDEIFAACSAYDFARVVVGNHNGWVLLVNGNDEDIISDYTVNLETVLADLNRSIIDHFG